MFPLARLVEEALENGWAVGNGSLQQIKYQSSLIGHEIVSSRKAGPLNELLKPTDQGHAPRQSLSATYGRGEQPLHTDGAHHVQPPEVVLLSVARTSDVPTLLWRFRTGELPEGTLDDLRHGLFTVRSGKDSFLAPALEGHRLRLDPGCMDAGDHRARRVLAFLESIRDEADRHTWVLPDTVLAIDNRRVLHARASTDGEPGRAMHRVTLKRLERQK